MRQAQSARAQQQSSRPQLIQSMIDAMRVPDLRSKILFTLGMLVVFRFVAQVPIPASIRSSCHRHSSSKSFSDS